MKINGNIYKMSTKLNNFSSLPNVEYALPIGEKIVNLNPQIGNYVNFTFLHEIHCIGCNRKISKSFAQGYCYPCLINSPETSKCILKPELCQAQDGIARDMGWAEQHCLQKHYVYLALSSNIKVGVTRSTQIPMRWIDQGATKTIKFASTPNRYIAGLIEVEIKNYISDRTSWQKMLKNIIDTDINLQKSKTELIEKLPDKLKSYADSNNEIINIIYPVDEYPQKVTSVGFDKFEEIHGKISGIKGQYLIFDDGRVLNIRKHNGYKIQLEF
tara:strand:+ start:1832 stop:2644 length:813 start_codon:yes stop_codon:yes gene_type:complete